MYFGGSSYGGLPLVTPNVRVARFEEYTVLEAPEKIVFTVDEVKSWAKIPLSITDQDVNILLLIKAVTEYFERYTNRILINTKFRTYSDYFAQVFEFSKGKRQSLDSFQYLKNGSFVDIDSSLYQILDESFYWRIIFSEYQNIPKDKDDGVNAYQSVRIDFVAGFGPDTSDVPPDIKIAMLNHIIYLYENRGDCETSVCSECSGAVPKTSLDVYNKYRHLTVFGSKYRGI